MQTIGKNLLIVTAAFSKKEKTAEFEIVKLSQPLQNFYVTITKKIF